METFNELVLLKTSKFQGTTTPDKNGEDPFWFEILAGRAPNTRLVQSGTVAKRAGFELGKTYLASCRLRGTDKVFGDDYTWNMIMEVVDPVKVVELQQSLGAADIFIVERPEGYDEAYHRIGDAVEGLQTKRAKDGNYVKVNSSTSTNHRTARKVTDGTSVKGATEQQLNLSPEDLKNKKEDESVS